MYPRTQQSIGIAVRFLKMRKLLQADFWLGHLQKESKGNIDFDIVLKSLCSSNDGYYTTSYISHFGH